MDHSPIYQTRSTRVLYYRQSPKAIVKYALGGALLVLAGALLGRGVPLTHGNAAPAASSAPSVAVATTAPVTTAAATASGSGASMGSSLAVVASGATAVATVTPVSARPLTAASAQRPQQWRVAGTGGLGLCLRLDHALNAPLVGILPDTMVVTAVDQDVQAAGHLWHHVSLPDGRTGWVAAEYLSPTS